MNTTKHSQGFGLVAVLAVFVCLGVAGLAGWYVMSKHASTSKPTTVSEQKAAQQKREADQGNGPQQTKLKDEFREVPELGIKIRLTDTTKDLAVKVMSPRTAGFSLQSFIDATATVDTVHDNDGQSACLSRVSVGLFAPEQREQLENDPIQGYKFDDAGRPLDGQGLVQLADKRYAMFRGYQATCIKSGDNGEALQKRENEIRDLLYKVLPENISSLYCKVR